MYEILLRFQHGCPYNNLSKKFPTAKIALWDNFQKEFLDARSDDKKDWPRISRDLEELAKSKGSRILRKTSDGKGYQFLVMTCNCERKGTTLNMLMESDCLFIPPITLYGGWETYRAIAFDGGSIRRVMKRLRRKGVVELSSQKKIEADRLGQSSVVQLMDPLSGLTTMQLNALATSMALGYYRIPRRTSTGKMAAALKVPRTTFQEHRKKAESKLMAALGPYVLTYIGTHGA